MWDWKAFHPASIQFTSEIEHTGAANLVPFLFLSIPWSARPSQVEQLPSSEGKWEPREPHHQTSKTSRPRSGSTRERSQLPPSFPSVAWSRTSPLPPLSWAVAEWLPSAPCLSPGGPRRSLPSTVGQSDLTAELSWRSACRPSWLRTWTRARSMAHIQSPSGEEHSRWPPEWLVGMLPYLWPCTSLRTSPSNERSAW